MIVGDDYDIDTMMHLIKITCNGIRVTGVAQQHGLARRLPLTAHLGEDIAPTRQAVLELGGMQSYRCTLPALQAPYQARHHRHVITLHTHASCQLHTNQRCPLPALRAPHQPQHHRRIVTLHTKKLHFEVLHEAS